MKAHTNDFKTTIKEFGREIDSKIMYGTTELGKEQLNSVTPHYESSLLKSVMKQLDIDSNVDIPLETVINYQFGVKVGNEYEYLNYGNYVVYKSEKQEDTRSWKITCYDKMLYAMKDYESLGVTYPITIKNYLEAICTKLGLTLASNDFVNANKEITSELYLDSEGNSLEYTYRDVLDEIAQTTASVICINENDELEVKYPQNVGEYETQEGTSLSIENVDDGSDLSFDLNGNTVQDGTPTPTSPIAVETVTGRQDIEVCGKNLTNFTTISYTQANSSIVTRTDGTYTVSNSTNQYGSVRFEQSNLRLEPSTTYTFSAKVVSTNTTGGSSVYVNASYTSDSTAVYGNKVMAGGISYITFTTPNSISNSSYIALYPREANKETVFTDIQLEKGNQQTTYEEYKGNTYEINLGTTELCKIGDYKDFIRKGTGKNLIDDTLKASATNNVYVGASTTTDTFPLKKGTYTISSNVSCLLQILNSSTVIHTPSSNVTSFTFTLADDTDIRVRLQKTGITANDVAWVQLEKGNQATEYEPFGYKDKWYLYKAIGKVVLNGSENWITWNDASTENTRLFGTSDYDTIKNYGYSVDSYSNYFKNYKVSLWNLDEQGFTFNNTGSNLLRIRINKTIADGTTALKTWLSTNNTLVYYVLATPTTTEITDTELINQLESVRLLQGLNNVSITSDNLSTPIKMTYLKYFDTIDEEYLKDVNVNFGEKFGPVNSVVLSRSAESDNIYRKDDESIEENGLTEIKIKDNQILNGNNRDEFIDGIFNKLKGLEYYVNDYVSTGIAYLELGDFYKVQVENNYYKCLMLNDELDVTQGLQEPIHTERMEDSETDYKNASKTDRTINQAYIIVDKQNQQITSVVQNINTLQTMVNSQGEQIDALGTNITQTINNITASVTSIQEELNNGVNLVKTTTVTVDDEGLTVATDNSKTTTIMTSDKFAVRSGEKDLAFFGYDDEIGSTKAEMDNLTVTNYFVAGYHRIEKYDVGGEQRTGVFYIGE